MKKRWYPAKTSTGTIYLVRVKALYRILNTRKPLERAIANHESYRQEKHELIHAFYTPDRKADYDRLISLFADKQVVDESHVTGWYDLNPQDVEFIISLGNGK